MSPTKPGAAGRGRGRGWGRGGDLGAAFGVAARNLGGARGGLAAATGSPEEIAGAALEKTAKLFASKLNQVGGL